MAKTTRNGGASFESDDGEHIPIRRAELGRVDQSAKTTGVGTDSSASSGKAPIPDAKEIPSLLPLAPTTENPSSPQGSDRDSTARSTGGDTQKAAPQPSGKSKPAARKSTISKPARVRNTDDEDIDELFDEFD